MFSSSVMRSVTLFASAASLVSLPLFASFASVASVASLAPVASAAPINILEIYPDGSMVERSIDERDYHASRNRTRYMKERSFDFDDEELGLQKRAKDYELDCKSVPEVCANICYYHHCKGGSLMQTPKSGRTVAAACKKSPNKCSVKSGYPHAGYQCDEYPMASTNEGGGANTATRCVPGGQNASSGGKFNAFPKGVPVKTVLLNTGSAPFYCDKKCDRKKDTNGKQE